MLETRTTTKKTPARKAPAKKAPAKKAPAKKAPARRTTSRPSPPDLEQLVKDTAERVAHEVTAQLGDRISRLEKEVERTRKIVKKGRKGKK